MRDKNLPIIYNALFEYEIKSETSLEQIFKIRIRTRREFDKL